MRLLIAILIFSTIALSAAWAQPATDTPTATATQTPTATLPPTNTPTKTPTAGSTPTPDQRNLLMFKEGCSSAPCDSIELKGFGAAHKTVAVEITGTATVQVRCRVVRTDSSLIQRGADLTASGIVEFDTWCDGIVTRITACTNCVVSTWLRTDYGQD